MANCCIMMSSYVDFFGLDLPFIQIQIGLLFSLFSLCSLLSNSFCISYMLICLYLFFFIVLLTNFSFCVYTFVIIIINGGFTNFESNLLYYARLQSLYKHSRYFECISLTFFYHISCFFHLTFFV